jgi:hypothetical protein
LEEIGAPHQHFTNTENHSFPTTTTTTTTTTNIMAANDDYIFVLETLCGFSVDTVTAIIDQGVNSTSALIESETDELIDLIKGLRKAYATDPDVNFTMSGIQRLEAFAQWCKDTDRRGFVAEAAGYDGVEMAVMLDRIKELKEYKRAKPDLPEVKALADLKDWRTFFEALCNRLGKQRGAATAPLSYVFRTSEATSDAPAPIIDYDDMLYVTLEVSGAHFLYDNKVVWSVVKGLTVEGPAWTHIKKYDKKADGRGAILALRAQMEGQNSFLLRRQEAYATFKTTWYRGHRKAFTFDMYIERFLQAFNELEATEEPMSESRKVTVFLSNIEDSTLETAKTVVYGDAVKQSSFQECQQYLSTIIASQKVHQAATPRSVALLDSEHDHGSNMSEDGSLKLSASMQYENSEWSSLTPRDKKTIWDLRKAAKRNGKPHGSRGNGGGSGGGGSENKRHQQLKRKLAALKSKKANALLEREIAALEGVGAVDDESDDKNESIASQTRSKAGDDAGSQFGRSAYKKRS